MLSNSSFCSSLAKASHAATSIPNVPLCQDELLAKSLSSAGVAASSIIFIPGVPIKNGTPDSAYLVSGCMKADK